MNAHCRTALMMAALFAAAASSHAAEDFQLRYNLAGSLGGEIFAPPDLSGLTGGVALTRVDIRKLTGDDGHTLTRVAPGGTVALPPPTPAMLYPTYDARRVRVDATGELTQWNLGLAYITPELYGGGRVALAFSLPYGMRKQSFRAVGATPGLHWNANVPSSSQAPVDAQFGVEYQGGLAAMAAAEGGEVAGFGDAELHAGWRYADAQWRVLAGASVVLPTGRYSAAGGPDIGMGNFYTLRPAAQVVYLPHPDLALAGRLTLGFNSRNRDNDLRSGNWASVEAAAGYMTRLGPVGVHVVQAQQFQDDSGNPWGTSRYRSTNAGLFFTTRIPGIDTVLTLQYMATLASRNAKHGRYLQLRMSKSF